MKGRVGFALAGLAVAAGVAAAIVLVFADGGDDDEEPTRAAYLAEVDRICTGYEARLRRIGAPSTTNPAIVAQQLAQVIPLVTARLRELRSVEVPEAMRAQVARMFAAQDAATEGLRRVLAEARARNVARMARAYGAFLALGEAARAQAEAVGITC